MLARCAINLASAQNSRGATIVNSALHSSRDQRLEQRHAAGRDNGAGDGPPDRATAKNLLTEIGAAEAASQREEDLPKDRHRSCGASLAFAYRRGRFDEFGQCRRGDILTLMTR